MSHLARLLLVSLLLVGCSADKRQTRAYLEAMRKDVQPALDQATVISQLTERMRPGNLQAGWPVLKKNLEELQQKTSAAQGNLQQVKVPEPAGEVHKLVQEELAVVDEMATKALSLGEQASHLGSGLPALRKLGELKPQLDQLKQLQFRHIELSTKLKASLEELRRQQHL